MILFGATVSVVEDALFFGDARNQGSITGETKFTATSSNYGTVIGPTTFSDTTTNNGSVVGAAVFADGATNEDTVTGATSFSGDTENNGTVTGNASFTGSAANYGTVDGNATFNETAKNAENASVTGNGTFTDCAMTYADVNGELIITRSGPCPKPTNYQYFDPPLKGQWAYSQGPGGTFRRLVIVASDSENSPYIYSTIYGRYQRVPINGHTKNPCTYKPYLNCDYYIPALYGYDAELYPHNPETDCAF